jgi:hypothetical protein
MLVCCSYSVEVPFHLCSHEVYGYVNDMNTW